MLRQMVAGLSVLVLLTLALTPSARAEGQLLSLMKQITDLATEGRYADAVPIARRMVEIAEREAGPNTPMADLMRFTLAESLRNAGQRAEAGALYKRVLDYRARTLGPDHADLAPVVAALAQLALDDGRLKQAEPLIQRALAIRERTLGSAAPDTAMTRVTLGNLRQRQGRYDEARQLFERALTEFRSALGPDHIWTGVALNNLAEVEKAQGRLDAAEARQREGLAVMIKQFGADSVYAAPLIGNLGELALQRGRLAEAESLQRQALAIRERLLGVEHPDVATSLNNLALVLGQQGRADEAQALLRRALVILEAQYGANHPSIASTLNNLADALGRLGRPDEAETLLRRSLDMRVAALGPSHPDIAVALDDIVVHLVAAKRFIEAEPLARQSLDLREAKLDRDHPLIANSLNNLATLLDNLKRHDEAGPMLERSLAIRIARYGADHPLTAIAEHNLASHHLDRGNWRQALERFKRATTIWIARARAAGNGRGEIAANADPFLGAAKAAFRVAEQTQEQAARLRADAFEQAQWVGNIAAADAIASMSARVAAGNPALAELVRDWQDLSEQARAVDRAVIAESAKSADERDPDVTRQLTERYRAITARLIEIDARLARDFAGFADLANAKPVSIETVQSVLGDDEVLISFAPTRDETLVWIVTSEASHWYSAPIGAVQLDTEVAALRCGLDFEAWIGSDRCLTLLGLSERPQPGAALPFDAARAHDLYRTLLAPAAAAIGGRALLVVPAGALSTLPLQVLPTAAPPAPAAGLAAQDWTMIAWLGRDTAITVLPSVAALASLRRAARTSAGDRPVLGIGNPLLDGDPDRVAQAARAEQSRQKQACTPQRLTAYAGPAVRSSAMLRSGVDLASLRVQSPLPETADEICAVAEGLGAGPEDVLLGAAATEAAIKAKSADSTLKRYRMLHFATHGVLGGQLNGLAEPGLILTPPAIATSNDDGYLSSGEIAALALDADAVILSACNTAGSEKAGGETLSGLARAFFYAGARALMVTHWAVDSDAAVALIVESEKARTKGSARGHAEALRAAMAVLMADRNRSPGLPPFAHPSAWAPFSVVGEGRTPL